MGYPFTYFQSEGYLNYKEMVFKFDQKSNIFLCVMYSHKINNMTLNEKV